PLRGEQVHRLPLADPRAGDAAQGDAPGAGRAAQPRPPGRGQPDPPGDQPLRAQPADRLQALLSARKESSSSSSGARVRYRSAGLSFRPWRSAWRSRTGTWEPIGGGLTASSPPGGRPATSGGNGSTP